MVEMVPTPFANKAAAKQYFETEFLEKMKNHPQKAILGPYLYTNIEAKPDGTADWRFNKAGILAARRESKGAVYREVNPSGQESSQISYPISQVLISTTMQIGYGNLHDSRTRVGFANPPDTFYVGV